MAKSRITKWQTDLLQWFEESHHRVLSPGEVGRLLAETQSSLGVPKSLTVKRFISFLLTNEKLIEIKIRRDNQLSLVPSERSTIRRYVWGRFSPYSIALSLRGQSYLSHSSALFLHGLTEQIPTTLYVNREQSPKTQRSLLSQSGIDRAFANTQRTSKYVFRWEEFKFVLLSGKNTGRLEVSQTEGPAGELLDVTKIERTLIDIVVRPIYAGGVHEVLSAFHEAKERISVNTVVATLKKLDYLYPYHQAIGFYMERAGFGDAQLDKLRSLGMKYDFYLANKLVNRIYDPKWRLYYPEGL